jgi:uncharacterized protein (TIGR04255 family)
MLSAFPDPDPALLSKPPAQLVTFSLTVEAERPLKPADGAAWLRALHERGFSPSILRKVIQQTVTVQAGGPLAVTSAGEKSDAWQVMQRDHEKNATLSATGFTLERSRYPGFDVFAEEVRGACDVFREMFEPSLRTRIALRYSNALSQPEAKSHRFWKNKVANIFLSLAADDRFEELTRTFSIVELQDNSLGVQIRSGLQPDVVYSGAIAFVFDIEASDNELTTFSVDDTLDALSTLNRMARQIFQTVLTPKYFATLKRGTHARTQE